jgi:hypothetical protein
MIVQELAGGQLLCINQTTHALLAEAFCRHWGNTVFARPEPYDAVMLAIAQHDNGWYEWEQQPRLREDGYPADFLHEADPIGKVALWTRGMQRAGAQHPYAGLLIGGHAACLYRTYPEQGLAVEAQQCIDSFVETQAELVAYVRDQWQAIPEIAHGMRPEVLEANIRLLQFGDAASLQLCMGSGPARQIAHCPVDFAGAETTIAMTCAGTSVHFDPWPFDVDHFELSVHGKLLSQRVFATTADYHAALAAAPVGVMRWQIIHT